jgi:hypothetical protein
MTDDARDHRTGLSRSLRETRNRTLSELHTTSYLREVRTRA